MSECTPTVFVVDDEPAACESVGALVSAHGCVAEFFNSAEEFLRRYDHERRGCLVLDQRMLGMSGVDLLRILNSEGWHMPVILITAYASVPMAVEAMDLGAVSVLEKPCRDQELWQNIDRALAMDAAAYEWRVRAREIKRRIESLTEDERAVLERIIEGRQNKGIAKELGIGLRTVEARRQNVFLKLQADSLADLLRLVLDAKRNEDGKSPILGPHQAASEKIQPRHSDFK